MRQILTFGLVCCSFLLFSQDIFIAPETGDLGITGCAGILYDSGGADGDYTENNETQITITGDSGDALSLTFTEFDLENSFDFMIILDGTSPSSPQVGIFSGSTLPNNGNPIQLSTNTATIFFTSDFTINGAGFALTWSCVDFTEPPVAAASFPSLSCNGTVAFSDASTLFPTSWAWDFGDGNTSTEQNPVHTYSATGTYDIQLIACNDNGCDTSFTAQALTYNPDDFVCTNAITMTYQGGDSTTLCTGALFDSGGPDGDYLEGCADFFAIIPPAATSISVTFTEFNLGATTNNHDQIYIIEADSDFFNTLAVYNGNELPNNGQPITFDVPGIIVYFISDHANNFPGFGLIWEANGTVTPPTANFTADNLTTPFGTAVQFTDLSTDEPGGWLYDFGDGNTSTEQNPSHVYNQAGTFTVTLEVINCNGSSIATPINITVMDPPALTFNPDSYFIEIDAGTSTTELLNLCNVGLGDLAGNLAVTGNAPQAGYLLEFTTGANTDGLTWQILDNDFLPVVESSQNYTSNTIYTETITGLLPNTEYYFVVNNPNGDATFDDFSLTDLGSGELIFAGFFEFLSGQIYIFPPPQEGTNGIVSWLSLNDTNLSLLPDACNDLTVTFDATDLIDGTYEGTIIINSNDPNQPVVTIPVTLVVNGTPQLSVSATNLDFGEVQVGGSATLNFEVENTGTADVEISNLISNNANFVLQNSDALTLVPGQAQIVPVTFSPNAIADFSETLNLVNNAGADVPVILTGTGIAAPSLTLNPTDFTIELVEGEDTTLNVTIGNIGEAVLNYDIQPFSNSTGFIFNFTTDSWGGEFSWILFDSNNNEVQNSEGEFYQAFTDYSVPLTGLSTAETYTLQLFDSFGDGALSAYEVVDALTGQTVAEGDFVGNIAQLSVSIGSPGSEFASISPTSGTLAIDENGILTIDVDATGLATGVYELIFTVHTNDPLQPTADITVTLYVIAPVTAEFSSTTFICGNQAANFTDISTNVPTSWTWDFGDGTTSNEQNPSHTYTADGFYTVSLVACNILGCDTIEKIDYIEVQLDCYTQNIPIHDVDTITVCEGTIYDSGGANDVYIEGNFGTLIIAPPGATSLSITFNEFNYQEHSDFIYLYEGTSASGNLIGTYTGTELQGQTIEVGSGVLTIVEYTDHFVNLSGFAATFACISNPKPPELAFTLSDSVFCANEPVAFIDQSSLFPTEWFWDFGDGATSIDQNPVHFYATSGTYTVTFTACNQFGCSTLIQDVEVTIDQDCVIENMPFEGTQTISGCSGTLYDSGGQDGNYIDGNTSSTTIISTGGPLTLEFISFEMENFDGLAIFDGADTNSPLLGYFTGNILPENVTSSGSVLTLVEYTDFVENFSGYEIFYSCAGSASITTQIVVTNTEICDGIRTFSAQTDGDVDSWFWEFGDGTTSTEANPAHEFPHNGAYQISLTTCQGNDCETATATIYTNKLTPEIEAPDTVGLGQEVHLHGLTAEATHWNWDFGNGDTSDEDAPITAYAEAGWHDIHVHLVNMDIHETCDANHTHSIFVDENLVNTEDVETLAWSIFPNPTTGQLSIKGIENLPENATVRLYSGTGQVIRDFPLHAVLSLEEYAAGMYVLEVYTNEAVLGRVRVVKK